MSLMWKRVLYETPDKALPGGVDVGCNKGAGLTSAADPNSAVIAHPASPSDSEMRQRHLVVRARFANNFAARAAMVAYACYFCRRVPCELPVARGAHRRRHHHHHHHHEVITTTTMTSSVSQHHSPQQHCHGNHTKMRGKAARRVDW